MARFTPVTTASSGRPWAYVAALVRHEPPGRSMNSTAGLSATAAERLRNSASRSQPALLTGTSASAIPAIDCTAATSAAATSAWETMTPRNGLLIVLFEIRLQLPPLRHVADQALVQALRRINAAVAQQVRHGDDFADHREILARIQRDGDAGNGDLENVRGLAIEPRPVVFARGVPIGELHHDLDALLLPHRPD